MGYKECKYFILVSRSATQKYFEGGAHTHTQAVCQSLGCELCFLAWERNI